MTQMQLGFRELQEKERAAKAGEALKQGELDFKEKELKFKREQWYADSARQMAQHFSDNVNKITTAILTGLL